MMEGFLFWMGKMLAELVVALSIAFIIIIGAVIYQVVSDYKERRYWKKQSPQWRATRYHSLMSGRSSPTKWQRDMYYADQKNVTR